MNLLFCGDIVGRPGRQAIAAHLPGLRDSLALDFVVANGENAAAGFGITAKICGQLHDFHVPILSMRAVEILKHLSDAADKGEPGDVLSDRILSVSHRQTILQLPLQIGGSFPANRYDVPAAARRESSAGSATSRLAR